MISIIKELPANIIGFRCKGKVTAKDYESVLYPAFEKALKKSKKLTVLWQMDDSFRGFSLGAVKDDMQMGIKYFHDFRKIAFVSDEKWMNRIVSAFGFLIPGHVRTFKNKKLADAISWLE
ncbi:MAG: STAS/SEC14 domain-containing protein [Bacteroidota bacterium]